jgi:hypothetical protein
MTLKKFGAHNFIHAHPAHFQIFILEFSSFEIETKNREDRLTDQAEIREV